jgi:SAM-dependent methyltransferase
MASCPADYFGGVADRYDAVVRRVVPGYDEMTERLLDQVPAGARRVLELGCGTGQLAAALARREPGVELTLLDAAPEMLEATRARLAEAAPGAAARAARFVQARFESMQLSPGYYDVIVASLSLHHVEDMGPLYDALAAALRPGGLLCLADQLRPATPAQVEIAWARWLAFCRGPGGCSEADLERVVEHARTQDHDASLEEHFAMLARAGFICVDCVWRSGRFGVVTAMRPALRGAGAGLTS